MLGKLSESQIDLICSEPAFPEFPELLFGTQVESSTQYFDATSYIQKKNPKLSAQGFFDSFGGYIDTLANTYEIRNEDIYKTNLQGHLLIESSFIYLFISYVEPTFMVYMCERMNELFANGICLSDTFLLQSARSRLTKEVIDLAFRDEQQTDR